MPALVAGIHALLSLKQGVGGRVIGERKRRRSSERLCPAMTKETY